MKSPFPIATMVAQVLVSWSCHGQATFELTNRRIEVGVDAPVFDERGVPLEGAGYQAELYGGRIPGSLFPAVRLSSFARLKVNFLTGLGAGYFRTFEGVAVTNVPGSQFAWLQIRAWDTRLGASYDEVVAKGLGGYGESPLFYALGGDSGHLGPPPLPLIGLQSFRLRPITPAVLMRSVQRLGDQVVVEWHPGFARYQLQQTSALGELWQNVGEPTSATSVTNSITGNAQFFRVVGLLD